MTEHPVSPERGRIAEALAEAAFTGQLSALEDESVGAVDRARVLVDFVLDRHQAAAVDALREAADAIERHYDPQDGDEYLRIVERLRAAAGGSSDA